MSSLWQEMVRQRLYKSLKGMRSWEHTEGGSMTSVPKEPMTPQDPRLLPFYLGEWRSGKGWGFHDRKSLLPKEVSLLADDPRFCGMFSEM